MPAARRAVMDPWILWAREEMARRLHEPYILEQLAAATELPLARFTHVFTETEGIAPDAYLHQLRLERAKVLLERTFLSVDQAIALIGLRDAKQFEDDFRNAFGVPPQTLREQAARRC
jgi:transcriptional regulator GlxA family with amidase domain